MVAHGKLVFDEKGSTAMLLAHLQKTPVTPFPSYRNSGSWGLDRAIMMCLAKDQRQAAFR